MVSLDISVMQISIYAALILPVTSICYLLGYWSQFGIDPLPYIGFEQLLSHSVGAFFTLIISGLESIRFTLITLVSYLLIVVVFLFFIKHAEHGSRTQEIKFNTKTHLLWFLISITIVFKGLLYLVLFDASLDIYVSIAVYLAILNYLSYIFLKNSLLSFLSDNFHTARIFFLTFFNIPAMALTIGVSVANLNKHTAAKVDWVLSEEDKILIETVHIGKIGTKEVFYRQKDDRTFIISASTLKGFSVK